MTVLNTFYKIISKLINMTLSHSVEDILPSSLVAYRKGNCRNRTLRYILDMKDIIIESKFQAYIIQYDLAAAQNTMSRNCAYACFEEMGVPEIHITLIKNLIEDNEANITKENTTIGKIKLETGIGQGNANSNVIFNIGNILIATVPSNIKGIKK